MKKKLLNIVLALTVVIAGFTGFSGTAKADEIGVNWNVYYDKDGKVTSDFSKKYPEGTKSQIAKAMPGDVLYYEVTYKNEYKEAATFYLNAGIVSGLEDSVKDSSGGAYSYVITNEGEELFNSQTVGGDNKDIIGLAQVDKDDKTFFSLGSLKSGESKTIRVAVTLDGNTINNNYMADLAGLSLDVVFGAEPTSVADKGDTRTETITKTAVRRIVKVLDNGTEVVILDDDVPLAAPRTGDSLLPLVMCGLALVLGLLMIAWYFMLTKNDGREEA